MDSDCQRAAAVVFQYLGNRPRDRLAVQEIDFRLVIRNQHMSPRSMCFAPWTRSQTGSAPENALISSACRNRKVRLRFASTSNLTSWTKEKHRSTSATTRCCSARGGTGTARRPTLPVLSVYNPEVEAAALSSC